MDRKIEQQLPLYTATINDTAQNRDQWLPRDTKSFRLVHAIVTHRLVSCSVIIEILLCLWLIWLSVINGLGFEIFLIITFGGLIIVLTVILTVSIERSMVLTKLNRLSLLKEVAEVKPGLDPKKWDSIAARLNQVFNQNSSWATRNFFYDGESCASCFRSRFLNPYLNRTRPPTSTVPTAAPPPPTPTPSNPIDELEPFIAEAAEAYQESLETFWKNMSTDMASSSV